jgi:hypothetical protein
MVGYTGVWMDRQVYGWTDRCMDGQTGLWMDRQVYGWTDRQLDGKADGQGKVSGLADG